MKFKIVEDVLNEGKEWFEVSDARNSNSPSFFIYGTNYGDIMNTVNRILSPTKVGEFKQSFNTIAVNNFINTFNKTPSSAFNIVSCGAYLPNPTPNLSNILTKTERGLRKEANDLAQSWDNSGPNLFDKLYVHHKDGQEHNNDPKNLLIWDNQDLALAHIAHIVAHDSSNFTKSARKTIDIVEWSGTNWNRVAQVTVTY